MNFSKTIILFCLFLGPIQKAFSARGGESSGGGSLMYRQAKRPILLDLFRHNPDFEDIYLLSRESKITPSQFSLFSGFDFIKVESLPVYELAKIRLNAWRETSRGVVNLIESTLTNMPWRYTPLFVKSHYKDSAIKGLVYYHQKYGAWISAPRWNQAGDYTQAGLLIHEALRHIQLFYEGEIVETDLLKLTAMIMLEDPKNGETLDNTDFF